MRVSKDVEAVIMLGVTGESIVITVCNQNYQVGQKYWADTEIAAKK